MDKTIVFEDEELALLKVYAGRVHMIAAVAVEFYDTLKAGDLPEDLCKELARSMIWTTAMETDDE